MVGPHVGAILGVFIFHFILLETDQPVSGEEKINSSQLPIVDYEKEMANEVYVKPQANNNKAHGQRLQYQCEEYVDIASPI